MGKCCSKDKDKDPTPAGDASHRFELKVTDEPRPAAASPPRPTVDASGSSKSGAPVQSKGESTKAPEGTMGAAPPTTPPPPPPLASASAGEFGSALRSVLTEELGLNAMSVIDAAKALEQSSGDAEFMLELMESYQGEYVRQLAEIKRGLQQQDWYGLAMEAHSLKGAAANLFILRMRAVSHELEKMGKAMKKEVDAGEQPADTAVARVQELIPMLESAFAEFEVALAKLRACVP
jgi:HPt (histidine-containing phosphotransfer) domain-containing protein